MKQYLFLPLVAAVFYLAPLRSTGQALTRIDRKDLQQLLSDPSDTLHVINFWATWCAPCVRELPGFDQVHTETQGRNVKVTLVSLDFRKDIESRLCPFIEKHKVKPPVVVLDDPDENAWISLVDKSWSGALPATLVYNKARNIYRFREGEITLDELQTLIAQPPTSKP